ncbi:unnamed protein product [Caenorhabditis brenneri]
MESQLQLINMPEDPMRHILERCDFVSLQCLRKTCHTFRNFIDDTKPLQLIEDLSVHGNSEEISLTFFGSDNYRTFSHAGAILLDYNGLEDGNTKITWHRKDGRRERIIENNNTLDVFSRDFGTFLGCTQQKWDKITLRCDKEVLKKIQENVLSLTSPLKVNALVISSTESKNSVMEILRSPCPETLTHLHIGAAFEHWNISEMVKLAQWKKAKELEMRSIIVSADIENYYHFENVEMYFENVTVDDLCKLKKIFLTTPSITKRFELHGIQIPSEEMVITTFGEPYLINPVSKYWYFKRHDNYVLCVNSYGDGFYFSVITKDVLPQDALIL